MGMLEIENKIVEEAQAEARQIALQAEAEADQIIQQASTQAEKLRQQMLEDGGQRAREEKLARIIPARLAAKKRLLEAKQQMLSDVFAGCPPETREAKEIEVANYLYG